MARVGAVARVAGLVAGEVAAVVALRRLGSAPGFGLPPGADVGQWLHDTPPVDAGAAVLRLVALACAWWLLASTVSYLVSGIVRAARSSARRRSPAGPSPARRTPGGRSSARRRAAGIRHLELLTLPGVRRLVDTALAVAVVGGATLAGPAATAAPAATPIPTPVTTTTPAVVLQHPDHRPSGPTPTAPVRAGRAGLAHVPAAAPPSSPAAPTSPTAPSSKTPPSSTTESPAPPTATATTPAHTAHTAPTTSVPTSPGPPANTPAPGGLAPAPEPAPATVPSGAATPTVAAPAPPPAAHVVATGESLWTIAADRVAELTNRPRAALQPADIAPYWQAVCDANRGRVRSGNLSLVFPGEVIELPAS